jgi:hypothetical protein
VGFDFEKANEKIAHPIPKDVKGKYLELAKKKGANDEEDDEEDKE